MNPLTRSAIRELRDVHGIELDPVDDLSIILDISRLADEVLDVERDLQTEAILRPVVSVGNIELRRISVGALTFLRDEVSKWFAMESEDMILSFAYCHANGHDPAKIWGAAGNPSLWKKRVKDWVKTCGAPEVELLGAIESFQARISEADKILEKAKSLRPARPDSDDEDESGSGSLRLIFTSLVSRFGQTVEYWAWRAPTEELEMMIDALITEQEREAKSAARAKGGPPVPSDPNGTRFRKHRALRIYMDKVIAEKKGA